MFSLIFFFKIVANDLKWKHSNARKLKNLTKLTSKTSLSGNHYPKRRLSRYIERTVRTKMEILHSMSLLWNLHSSEVNFPNSSTATKGKLMSKQSSLCFVLASKQNLTQSFKLRKTVAVTLTSRPTYLDKGMFSITRLTKEPNRWLNYIQNFNQTNQAISILSANRSPTSRFRMIKTCSISSIQRGRESKQMLNTRRNQMRSKLVKKKLQMKAATPSLLT